MTISVKLESFTPSEVEEITGLSTTLQRDWRRRNYIKTGPGHARYLPSDLARLAFMKALADRGIGPALSFEVADWAEIGILWWMYQNENAFEGDHWSVCNHLPKPVRPHPEEWRERGLALAKMLLRDRGGEFGGGRLIPARFFMWWPNGEHEWVADFKDQFDVVKNDCDFAGPVVCLDQEAIARCIIKKSGRAIVRINIPEKD